MTTTDTITKHIIHIENTTASVIEIQRSVLGVLDSVLCAQREIVQRLEALELAMPSRVPRAQQTKRKEENGHENS